MFSSNTSQTSGGYEIQRSLRFNSADSAYLNRTPASAGNQSTWTLSFWIKRSAIGSANTGVFYQQTAASDTGFFSIVFPTADTLVLEGWTSTWRITNQLFRDPSAWYHIVVSVDTTQATANNRIRLYVNGSEVTSFSTIANPTQNATTGVNGTGAAGLGRNNSFYFNGYMTEVYMVDGQALTPSSFGAFDAQTGVWGPTPYAGSYGTNGFYLNFSDNSNTTAATLGRDYSGNGNNWTPNNFSVSAGAGNDSLVDVPTNWGTDTGVGGTVRGNYCTLNPLDNGGLTLSNGNLQFDKAATGWKSTRSTFGMATGKWYWESTITAATGEHYCQQGVALSSADITSYFSTTTAGFAYESDALKINGSFTSYGASYGVNDVIGVAFDADAGTLTFYKNGTSQGTAYSGMAANTYFPAVGLWGTVTANINFGQRPFAYTAPSGFKALNTQNLPTPTIGATTATQAGKYFNTVTYTGTGANLSVTGVGFQPDWVWTKERDAAYNHGLFDSVRGATKGLASNTTSSEYTATDSLTAFNSDGFSLGTAAGENISGGLYVAWNWKANGAGVTNTAGSITSTVSANTTSGFSVVTYTGNASVATVGHGLGAVPKMIIVKSRSNAIDWVVYHESIPSPRSYVLQLNLSAAALGVGNYWGSSGPTSTTFGLNVYGGNNTASATYVAYCFAEVAGYSKFGSYTGNGSADGPFVFCGFRPAYVMVKNSSATGDWMLWDDTRSPANVVDELLYASLNLAEQTYTGLDFTANGFKIRNTSADFNANGNSYIFMAFAEAPQKFALAR